MKKITALLLTGVCMSGLIAENSDKRVTVRDKEFAIRIHHTDIQKRIKELGTQITRDYAGKKPVLVGVLNGAFIFLSDLVRELDIECEIDFIQIASYGTEMHSSGNVQILKQVSHNLAGRDVIIVEDIIDSGLSIQHVRDIIQKQNPRSVRVAAFLHKNIANLTFPIDYIGFNIKPDFVIGYGLDYGYNARNLKDVYSLI